MKYLLLLLLILPLDGGRHIKGKGFEGYIFPKEYPLYLHSNTPMPESLRFTPEKDDIESAEKILQKDLKTLTLDWRKGWEPIIYKELKMYTRQYVGIYNDKGQRVIWINCLWKKSGNNDLIPKQIVKVSDGGNYYWNIKVNLDTHELYELYGNSLG